MRMLGILTAVLLIVSAAYPQGDAAKKELGRLEGKWKYVKVEAPDQIAQAIAEASIVEFRGNKMIHTITLSTGKKNVIEATIKLDPTKKPKTIDITPLGGPEKGKTFQGIYELHGDTLKLHLGDVPEDRPSAFKYKKGSARSLSTLRRTKSTLRQTEKVQDRDAEIRALLEERHKTLTKVLELLTAQYKEGATDFSKIYVAMKELTKASVELDCSPEKRLAALRADLESAKGILQLAKERFDNGQVTEVDVLQARLMLINATIELLREEGKSQPRK